MDEALKWKCSEGAAQGCGQTVQKVRRPSNLFESVRAIIATVKDQSRTWRKIMTTLEMICGFKSAAKPEIVWRNPRTVRSHRRRHTFERAGRRALYIQQEFVDDGRFGYWTTISDLEVVIGGRAA